MLEMQRLKLINKELVLNRTKVKNKCHRLGIIARHKRYPNVSYSKMDLV